MQLKHSYQALVSRARENTSDPVSGIDIYRQTPHDVLERNQRRRHIEWVSSLSASTSQLELTESEQLCPYLVHLTVAITGAVLIPDRVGLPFTSKIEQC